jgi:nitric oxide dioxygenase
VLADDRPGRIRAGLLEESFDLLLPRGDDLVAVFYQRLFSIAPRIAHLFGGVATDVQRRKFLSTLVLLRRSWRNFDAIEPELVALGERHRRYSVLAEQYPIVGDALIGAMVEIGGQQWKPAYTTCWREAYAVVQNVMLRGAASPVPDAVSASG